MNTFKEILEVFEAAPQGSREIPCRKPQAEYFL